MEVFLHLLPIDTVQEFIKLQTQAGRLVRILRNSFALRPEKLVVRQVWISSHFEDAGEP
jgi:hypothetical protein